MLSLHNHQNVELGSYAVDGVLPDMHLTGCKVTWGDYPPARIGQLNLDDNSTLKEITLFTTGPRVVRHWLFWFKVMDTQIWMKKLEADIIRIENCTFADPKLEEEPLRG